MTGSQIYNKCLGSVYDFSVVNRRRLSDYDHLKRIVLCLMVAFVLMSERVHAIIWFCVEG